MKGKPLTPTVCLRRASKAATRAQQAITAAPDPRAGAAAFAMALAALAEAAPSPVARALLEQARLEAERVAFPAVGLGER